LYIFLPLNYIHIPLHTTKAFPFNNQYINVNKEFRFQLVFKTSYIKVKVCVLGSIDI
jgi:hypothetical protein